MISFLPYRVVVYSSVRFVLSWIVVAVTCGHPLALYRHSAVEQGKDIGRCV